uniref:Putative secreted protein n=1 Tax=Anopheles triannulatus TaxID=58253 RepID=A0A2M4B421_9DIPT
MVFFSLLLLVIELSSTTDIYREGYSRSASVVHFKGVCFAEDSYLLYHIFIPLDGLEPNETWTRRETLLAISFHHTFR